MALSCWHCPPLAFSSHLLGETGHPLPISPRAIERICPRPPGRGPFFALAAAHSSDGDLAQRQAQPPATWDQPGGIGPDAVDAVKGKPCFASEADHMVKS